MDLNLILVYFIIYLVFGRSAYILKQDSLPSSYKSFLNKHGGKDAVILQGVKEIASSIPFSNLDKIEKYYKSIGVDVKLDPNMKVPCSVCNLMFSFFFKLIAITWGLLYNFMNMLTNFYRFFVH